jgi:hypothetical protein
MKNEKTKEKIKMIFKIKISIKEKSLFTEK